MEMRVHHYYSGTNDFTERHHMVDGVSLILTAAEVATIVLGTSLTVLAYRASRRTGFGALRVLTLGIGLLTVGALLGTLLHLLWRVPLEHSLTVQSVFTAAGFATMTYSLFTDISPSPGRIQSDADPRE